MNDQEVQELARCLGPSMAKWLADNAGGDSCGSTCRCGGSCKGGNCSLDQRLSKWEVDDYTANRSDTLNFGTLLPGAPPLTIVVPAYPLGHRVSKFKFRPTMAPGGDADAIEIKIFHANRLLYTFRGLEFSESFCCELINRMRPDCFGYQSTWSVQVSHTGAVGDPPMQRATLTYTRCYPGDGDWNASGPLT